MAQFLFIVEIPPTLGTSSAPYYSPEWTAFSNEASTILRPVKTYKQLQLNAWLLPAENSLPVLLDLSSTAAKHNLAYSASLILKEIIHLTKPYQEHTP